MQFIVMPNTSIVIAHAGPVSKQKHYDKFNLGWCIRQPSICLLRRAGHNLRVVNRVAVFVKLFTNIAVFQLLI